MTNNLFKFFFIFCILYFLLVIFFNLPFVRKQVSAIFINSSDIIVSFLLSEAFILFHQHPNEKDDYHVQILYESQAKVTEAKQLAKAAGQSNLNFPLHAFSIYIQEFFLLQSLYLTGLILATPVATKKKMIMLLLGLATFYIFTNLKLTLIMLIQLQVKEVELYELNNFIITILKQAQFFLKNTTGTFIVATFIWIFVTFNKKNWQNLIEKLVTPLK